MIGPSTALERFLRMKEHFGIVASDEQINAAARVQETMAQRVQLARRFRFSYDDALVEPLTALRWIERGGEN